MTCIELLIRINNTFIPVLTIPIDDCNRFALKPLCWLRFLGYTIYGSPGHISTAPDGLPVDYRLAVRGGDHYYFTSPGIFIHVGGGVMLTIQIATARLLDNQCINDRISIADSTESCVGFRASLKDRDGTCIVTDAPSVYCDGAHILPHSKGSEVGLSFLTSFCNVFSRLP